MWPAWPSGLAAEATDWPPAASCKPASKKPEPACCPPSTRHCTPVSTHLFLLWRASRARQPESHPMSVETPDRLSLRRLPFPARLVLSAFLICVGIGYVSALVQLHFQHAKPGQMLPSGQEAADLYHGKPAPKAISQIERLIDADPNLKFNGSGQMRNAFFHEGKGWEKALLDRTEKFEGNEKKAEEE